MHRLVSIVLALLLLGSAVNVAAAKGGNAAPATNVAYVGSGLWHFWSSVTFSDQFGLLKVVCDRINQLGLGTSVPDVTAPVPFPGMTCVASFWDAGARVSAWSDKFTP